jgi:3D (Asp-Asp-Asp) domain-containing protein
MYVQGAGQRIALDTGGAIKGRHLDIWAPTYAQCVNWGAQIRSVWLEG